MLQRAGVANPLVAAPTKMFGGCEAETVTGRLSVN